MQPGPMQTKGRRIERYGVIFLAATHRVPDAVEHVTNRHADDFEKGGHYGDDGLQAAGGTSGGFQP